MPSSYTINLGLEKPATGEQAGVWGTTANNSYDFLDAGIDGNVSIALSASAYTLMTNQGTASNGRNKIIIFTGALTQDASITIAPNVAEKIYFILNQTTGGFGLVISQGTGATYRIAPSQSAVVYTTGLGGAGGVYGVLANFQCDSLLAATITCTTLAFTGTSTITGAASFTGGVTISPSLVLNLGGDASYDMYYRNTSGQVARLPNGTAGQVLVATATGPAWQTSPPPSVGMGITGSVPNQVFYANASSQLAQDANHIWSPTGGLGIGMNPGAGYGITIGRGLPAGIMLDSITPGLRQLFFSSAGAARWSLRSSGETESIGSNTGSNLQLISWNDANNVTIVNQSWFRSGRSSFGQYIERPAQVSIFNTQPGQTVLEVIGVAGQSGLMQNWLNSGGASLASMDAAGNLSLAGNISAANLLALTANKQLLINATISPQNYATLQLGPDASPFPGPSIGFQNVIASAGNFPMAQNYTRIYCKNHNFVIQFDQGGTIYYAYLPLTSAGATWNVTSSPPF